MIVHAHTLWYAGVYVPSSRPASTTAIAFFWQHPIVGVIGLALVGCAVALVAGTFLERLEPDDCDDDGYNHDYRDPETTPERTR